MTKRHIFIGKFCIEQSGDTDNCTVSAIPMTDEETDVLAGIVRCKDCKHFTHNKEFYEQRV